jgi:hypothetical protein
MLDPDPERVGFDIFESLWIRKMMEASVFCAVSNDLPPGGTKYNGA